MLKRYCFGIFFAFLSGFACSDYFLTIQDNIKTGNIVIIGETHQKPESTQLFALLVDAALERHQCLTVGLEINHNQQPVIDAVTQGEAQVSEIKIPYAIDHPGLRKLIDYLATLKSKTPCLRIEAIDADQDRDENMANRLSDLPRDRPILALLGNLHTLKKVEWTIKNGEPFVAEILVNHGLRVITYPQNWQPEMCEIGQGRSSRYVSAVDPEALQILNGSILSLINAKRHRSTQEVVDGFVLWECDL